eukprot:5984337-Prymnesium_polylepis.1
MLPWLRQARETWDDMLAEANADAVVRELLLLQRRTILVGVLRLGAESGDSCTRLDSVLDAISKTCDDVALSEGVRDVDSFLVKMAKGDDELARALAIEALRSKLEPGEWERIESRVRIMWNIAELRAAVNDPKGFTLRLLSSPEDGEVLHRDKLVRQKILPRLEYLDWGWEDVLPLVRETPEQEVQSWLLPSTTGSTVVHRLLVFGLWNELRKVLKAADEQLMGLSRLLDTECDDDMMRDGLADIDALLERLVGRTASGLEWHNVGDSRPASGSEITNTKLAQALEEQTCFTHDELTALRVGDLHLDDFIQSGTSYFKPSESKLARAATIEVLRSRLAPGEWERIASK